MEIRDSATVVLAFTRLNVSLKSQCDRTKIIVTRGQVIVRQPRRDVIIAGADRDYVGPVEVLTNGGTDFIVDCTGKRPHLPTPIKGILGVVGVAGTIAIGRALAGESVVAPSSPVR